MIEFTPLTNDLIPAENLQNFAQIWIYQFLKQMQSIYKYKDAWFYTVLFWDKTRFLAFKYILDTNTKSLSLLSALVSYWHT